MADANTIVHIGENSPEQVAFKLLQELAKAEGKRLYHGSGGEGKADRQWILDSYAECLPAAKGYREFGGSGR